MVLKSLTMQGFKSFPDRTVLEFDRGITAVVGPNGSGKSNISDAVRWVLGEQSTKSLRGSKMEDVVFGGTEKRKKMGFAEASLVFDNSSGETGLGSAEICVTRRYYRSGESEYRINGEVSRLKDIHELFMDTGIGRDGYSIISQGRISDIISSRGTERRDIFDEAAGISKFKYRRADANRKLEQAEENLLRLRDILSELESRVGPLKEQAQKAEKFIVLSEEKKELEIGLWLNTLEKSKEILSEQEKKLDIASAQYENAENELSSIESEIDRLIERARQKTVEAERIRNEISAVEQQAQTRLSQAAVLRNTVLHNNETVERISKDIENAGDAQRLAEKEKEEKTKELLSLKSEMSKTEARLSELVEELKSSLSGSDSFEKKHEELSERLSGITLELSEKRIEQSTAKSSISEISERLEAMELSVTSKTQNAENLRELLQKTQAEIEENRAALLSMNNSISGYEKLLGAKQTKLNSLSAGLDSSELNSMQILHKISNLEELEKNMEGYFGSVKSVMSASKRNMLSGIHGAVSMLIKTEPSYEAAIETALGAAMQNIVTETENDAKRAIEHLKRSNAGRCTFLPLSTVSGTELNEKEYRAEEGFVGIASGLVEADSRYIGIIKFLLGKTLVCENMDNAIALAKKANYRLRIVTLDGSLINAGGSMTGGSRKSNAGLLSRGGEIERLKKEREAILTRIENQKAEIKELSEEVSVLKAELDGERADAMRVQEEGIRLNSEERLVSEKLADCEKDSETVLQEMNTISSRREKLCERSEQLKSEISLLSEDMRTCEEELQGICGEQDKLKEKKQSIDSRISEINIKSVEIKKDIEVCERDIENISRRREDEIGRCDKIRAETEELLKRNVEFESSATEAEAEAEELKKKVITMKNDIELCLSERMKLEEKSGNLRVLEREKTGEREKLGGELARLEERKAAMIREYDEIVAKLYDEYSLTRREAEETGIKVTDIRAAQTRLASVKSSIKGLGNVNVGAVEEYKEVYERYCFMSGQVSDVERSKTELLKIIGELTENMRTRFTEQFKKINENFKVCFTELFGGGSAELVLCDESDILSCDIEIKVQPPGKNVQNIDLFSGGEKVLAAISLLFSILKVTPAPFCIFDEVEAALDDVNVDKYASYMRKMTGNIQFIAITHRRGTMDEADVLYGVTMQEKGVSKLLRLNAGEIAAKLGIDV